MFVLGGIVTTTSAPASALVAASELDPPPSPPDTICPPHPRSNASDVEEAKATTEPERIIRSGYHATLGAATQRSHTRACP
jgi:hypothetical protein